MNWHMVTDSEILHLAVPQRLFEYAYAYRDAASALCVKMTSEDASCTWPNAAVVLLLAAHATELFIKGAILCRDPAAIMEHHRIDDLSTEYRKLYPEPSFEWDIPFRTEYLGIAETEIEALKKATPVPSILYRYPVAKGGKEWNGAFGFEPHSFLELLKQVKSDFDRIKTQIA
ncbi:MAG: hypothetical protein ACXWTY_10350 [Methylobacter sp.]